MRALRLRSRAPVCSLASRRSSRVANVRRMTRLRMVKARVKREVVVKTVLEEDAFAGLSPILDSVKWSKNENLVPVIVQVRHAFALSPLKCDVLQHIDTGEVLMQAFGDRAALCETLQTKCAVYDCCF